MALVSISEAARLTKKSRTTLHRYVKQGKLSYCTDETNSKKLDTSELLRVFGSFNVTSETVQNVASEQHETQKSVTTEQHKIELLQQEIEHLKQLIEEKDKRMLLLEDKTKRKKWFIF